MTDCRVLSPDAVVTFTIDNENRYRYDRGERRYEVWSKILQRQFRSGGHVYVRVDQETGTIGQILPPRRREIDCVHAKPEGDKLMVSFNMAPSLYHLKASGGRYDEMRLVLEEAKRTCKELWVIWDPTTLEILDARR